MASFLRLAIFLGCLCSSLQTQIGPAGETANSCECKTNELLTLVQDLALSQAAISQQMSQLKNELLQKLTTQDAKMRQNYDALQKQVSTQKMDLLNQMKAQTMSNEKAVQKLNDYLQQIAKKDCQVGYTGFQDSCYKVVRASVEWPEAMQRCHEEGAHLVAIETREEQTFIEQLIKHTIDNRGRFGDKDIFWTGGHDQKGEGRWVWESTGEKIQYTNWDKGQPDNGSRNDEDCLQLWKGFKWNDDNCRDNFNYICEKKR